MLDAAGSTSLLGVRAMRRLTDRRSQHRSDLGSSRRWYGTRSQRGSRCRPWRRTPERTTRCSSPRRRRTVPGSHRTTGRMSRCCTACPKHNRCCRTRAAGDSTPLSDRCPCRRCSLSASQPAGTDGACTAYTRGRGSAWSSGRLRPPARRGRAAPSWRDRWPGGGMCGSPRSERGYRSDPRPQQTSFPRNDRCVNRAHRPG